MVNTVTPRLAAYCMQNIHVLDQLLGVTVTLEQLQISTVVKKKQLYCYLLIQTCLQSKKYILFNKKKLQFLLENIEVSIKVNYNCLSRALIHLNERNPVLTLPGGTLDMKHTSNVSYVSVTNVNFPLVIESFCDKICPFESRICRNNFELFEYFVTKKNIPNLKQLTCFFRLSWLRLWFII